MWINKTTYLLTYLKLLTMNLTVYVDISLNLGPKSHQETVHPEVGWIIPVTTARHVAKHS